MSRIDEATTALVLRLEAVHGCDLGVLRTGWHCYSHATCESIRGGSLILLGAPT